MYSERKLVTVEKILDVKPASNADALEIVKVRGWNGRNCFKVISNKWLMKE